MRIGIIGCGGGALAFAVTLIVGAFFGDVTDPYLIMPRVFFAMLAAVPSVPFFVHLLRSQGRGDEALGEAEAALDADPRASREAAERALRLGVQGAEWMRAWLLVAQFEERAESLAVADEALRRALLARTHGASGWLIARVSAAYAFTRAALGDLGTAARLIDALSPQERDHPTVRAEYKRAYALLLYKRGCFREVVDLAATSDASTERDRALLSALEHSSMLRLEGATAPMRVAEERTHDEWIECVVPELRARQ